MRAKKKILLTAIILTGFLIIYGCSAAKNQAETGAIISEETTGKTDEKVATLSPGTAYVRDIILDRLKGKERISLFLSELSPFTIDRESENGLLVKMERMFIPEELRKTHGEGRLDNVKSVFPFQRIEEGEKSAWIKIDLKKMVPYRVKKDESGVITIDFDVSSLPSKMADASPAKESADRDTSGQHSIKQEESAATGKIGTGGYEGEKISLELQPPATLGDALWTIAEVSGMSIIATPEIQKRTVTVRINKVPWDQALDNILEINGLGKKQSGTVIAVLPLEELKKAEEEQQKRDAVEGKLRQISIEARIVEANTDFRRDLGIQWGGGFRGTWGSRDYGLLMGSGGLGTDAGATGISTPFPNNIGFTGSNVAVNLPYSMALAPSIGMILGSSSFILNAQLSAMEGTGKGKIISSPRVTALEGKKAWIQQGKEVPFRTLDKDGNPTTDFKDVVLKLEVTPNITPDGRISMEIMANNDELDWANAVAGNPATTTSAVQSTIVINDGDTIVIGGVYKTIESESEEGVPFLSKIPVLGWLFKYQTKSKETRELLVFVTPRIMEEGSEKGK